MKKISALISLLFLTALLPGCSDKTSQHKNTSAAAVTTTAQTPVTPSVSGDADSDQQSDAGSAAAKAGGLEGQIMDQSFHVNLDGWEDVTFASFLPQKEEQGDGDVRFKLLKNGEAVYDFPGITDDNRCPGEKFDQVSAVAFKDYNGDGKTDVILILKYSPQTDPDKSVQKIRLYTQAGNSKKFTYDEYLAKRLMNDGCSTIQAIMDDIGENSNYQEALNEPKNGAFDNQLEVIAASCKQWAIPSKDISASSDYSYAVTDLDQNGRLELIVSTTQGSAHYTDSTYYEVNKTFDGLTPCVQDKKEGDPQGRLASSIPVYCDSKNGLYHYILTYGMSAGASSAVETKSSLSLVNGSVLNKLLVSRTEDSSQGTAPAVTYQDAEGKSISREAYDAAADTAYPGLTKKQADLVWISGLGSGGLDPLKADKDQLKEKLSESYGGFSIH